MVLNHSSVTTLTYSFLVPLQQASTLFSTFSQSSVTTTQPNVLVLCCGCSAEVLICVSVNWTFCPCGSEPFPLRLPHWPFHVYNLSMSTWWWVIDCINFKIFAKHADRDKALTSIQTFSFACEHSCNSCKCFERGKQRSTQWAGFAVSFSVDSNHAALLPHPWALCCNTYRFNFWCLLGNPGSC